MIVPQISNKQQTEKSELELIGLSWMQALEYDLLCKRLCHRPNPGSSVGVFTYLVGGPYKN